MKRVLGGLGGQELAAQHRRQRQRAPSHETSTAASVRANSRISRPTTPPMNISGVNTAISEIEMVRMVKPISPAPSSAASNGFCLFDALPDHLDHDDGVVDHEADGDAQGHQRQIVEAEAQRQHHRHRAQQRAGSPRWE